MTKKEKVFNKFGGLCAYTGNPLPDDWQIDHVHSKAFFEKILVKETYYKCIKTGNEISLEEYKLKSEEIINNAEKHYEAWEFLRNYKHIAAKYKPHPDCNKIENLVPALRIVNHYKRELDLEGFRKYMLNFHVRLSKLPKKTNIPRTVKRKEYLLKVADVFGISENKPFDGRFYFEKLDNT